MQHPRGGPRGLARLTQQLPGPLLSTLTPVLPSQASVLCAIRSTGQHQKPVGCRLQRQASTSFVWRCPVQQRGFPQRRERPGFTTSAQELWLISLHAFSRLQHLPSVPLCRLQHVRGRQRGLLLRHWGLWANQQCRWGSRDVPGAQKEEEAADAAATAASVSHGELQVSLDDDILYFGTLENGAWNILQGARRSSSTHKSSQS